MAIKLKHPIIYFLFLIAFTSVRAQKVNTNTDYSQLQNYEMSQDGKWVLIRKSYKQISSNDSVYIVNIHNNRTIKKKTNNRISFLNNSVLCIESFPNKVEFLNLNNNKELTMGNIEKFKLIKEQNLIFYLNTDTNTYYLSQIENDKEQVIWSENKDTLIYHELNLYNHILLVQDKVNITSINLKTLEKKILKHSNLNISNTFWGTNQTLVYLLDNNKLSHLLYCFDYSKNKIDLVDYKTLEWENNLEKIINIESIDHYRALVNYSSITGKKAHDTNQLEIWSTNDLNLERKSRDEEPLIRTIKYAIVNFNTNQIAALDHLDNQDVNVLNQKYILYHNTNQYYDVSTRPITSCEV